MQIASFRPRKTLQFQNPKAAKTRLSLYGLELVHSRRIRVDCKVRTFSMPPLAIWLHAPLRIIEDERAGRAFLQRAFRNIRAAPKT
jgi:hypothetical protein